jgi:hypothetical protein
LTDGKSVTVDGNDDTWLIVMFFAERGYLVVGHASNDKEYFNLIDRRLGDDIVTAFDGGDTRQFPRYVFIGEPLLLKAVETFFWSGRRDETCEWVNDREATYD